MTRVLSLVAGFFPSCTGDHRPPSIFAADRPHPDTQGQNPYRHLGCKSASLPGTLVSCDRQSAGTSVPWITPPRRHGRFLPGCMRWARLWCMGRWSVSGVTLAVPTHTIASSISPLKPRGCPATDMGHRGGAETNDSRHHRGCAILLPQDGVRIGAYS